MNANQQYVPRTVPPSTASAPEPRPASADAPWTFEPTDLGTLPPMFETEADHTDR